MTVLCLLGQAKLIAPSQQAAAALAKAQFCLAGASQVGAGAVPAAKQRDPTHTTVAATSGGAGGGTGVAKTGIVAHGRSC